MPHRDSAATSLYLAWLGAVTGAVAGLVESSLLAATRTTTIDAAAIVNTSVFYAIVWGVVALAIGVISWIVPSGRASRNRELLGSVTVCVPVLVLIGSYVNVMHLPSMLSAASLVFDVTLAAACWLLGWAIYSAWRVRVASGRPARRVRSPLVVATIGLPILLIAVALSGGAPGATETSRTERGDDGPNVLFLLVDALRADHLGCYGYSRPTSPNVDGLARGGVLFESAYAQGSRTKETTASIVTSLYASTHGVTHNTTALPEEAPTLMQFARNAGFRTAIFSANPLVSPSFGFARGVDHFYCDAPSAVARSVLLDAARKVSVHVHSMIWLPRLLSALAGIQPVRTEDYPYDGGDPGTMNGALLSWIDEGGDAGFVAYVHYMDTHTPYAPPPPYDGLFDPDYDGPKVSLFPEFGGGMLPFDQGEEIPEDERQNMIAQYDGSIANFDNEFGKLMEELAKRGLTDNTLVILTSDHGEEFYDHGGWGHGQSLYNELIRVPLIMWFPGSLSAGTRVSATVRHVDLLPTILGAVGEAEVLEAADLEGVNLWPLLEGGTDVWPQQAAMSEVIRGSSFSRAIKTGDLKLIHAVAGSRERLMLFDLLEDPRETRDLSGELPDAVESMFGRMARLKEAAASREKSTRTTVLDEGTREKLRALGYIQ